MKYFVLISMGALAALLILGAPLALGQEEGLISRTPEEISDMSLKLQMKFMSPYCPAANLRDCTSGEAETLREELRDWLREGRSEAWITEQMLDRFGESVLSAPRFQGMGIVAWVAPVVALAVGFLFVMAFLRRQSRARLQPVDGVAEPAPDYQPTSQAQRTLQEELDARSVR